MQVTLKAMRDKIDTLCNEYKKTSRKLNINSRRGAVQLHMKGQSFAYGEIAKELETILSETRITRTRTRSRTSTSKSKK